jgi:hypothetical protein
MKIHPVEAELFHADGRTERQDKANNLFSQFCKHALKYQAVATTSDTNHTISFW